MKSCQLLTVSHVHESRPCSSLCISRTLLQSPLRGDLQYDHASHISWGFKNRNPKQEGFSRGIRSASLCYYCLSGGGRKICLLEKHRHEDDKEWTPSLPLWLLMWQLEDKKKQLYFFACHSHVLRTSVSITVQYLYSSCNLIISGPPLTQLNEQHDVFLPQETGDLFGRNFLSLLCLSSKQVSPFHDPSYESPLVIIQQNSLLLLLLLQSTTKNGSHCQQQGSWPNKWFLDARTSYGSCQLDSKEVGKVLELHRLFISSPTVIQMT